MSNQNNSKNLRKKHQRGTLSDFEFLIQSMEQNKQNRSFNHNRVKQSQQLLATHRTNVMIRDVENVGSSLDSGKKPGKTSKQHSANSIITSQRNTEDNDTLGCFKKIIKTIEPLLIYLKTQNKRQTLKNLINLTEKKIQQDSKYLAISTQLSQKPVQMINSYMLPSKLRQTINIKDTIHQSNNDFLQDSILQKIQILQNEKDKLSNLVSQHQRANIKMFIKINEGESSQIQKYKKQLASLYESYKKLEKMIVKKHMKIKNYHDICIVMKNQLGKRDQKIEKMEKYIHKMKEHIKNLEENSIKNKIHNNNLQQSSNKENNPLKSNQIKGNSRKSPKTPSTPSLSSFEIHQLQTTLKQQNSQLQNAYNSLKNLMIQNTKLKRSNEQLVQNIEQLKQKQKKLIGKLEHITKQNNQLRLKGRDVNRQGDLYRMLSIQADTISAFFLKK